MAATEAPQANETLTPSGRIEAFSDGVFAIALTLLVLELKVPEADRAGSYVPYLLDQWPSYVAYVAAFAVLGLVWLSHHGLFSRIEHANGTLLVRNLILLFWASVFSFPTAVLSSALRDGTRADQVGAIAFYALASVLLTLTWVFVCRAVVRHPALVSTQGDVDYARRLAARSLLGCIPSVIGFLVVFISPWLSLAVFAVNPVFYFLVLRHSERAEVD